MKLYALFISVTKILLLLLFHLSIFIITDSAESYLDISWRISNLLHYLIPGSSLLLHYFCTNSHIKERLAKKTWHHWVSKFHLRCNVERERNNNINPCSAWRSRGSCGLRNINITGTSQWLKSVCVSMQIFMFINGHHHTMNIGFITLSSGGATGNAFLPFQKFTSSDVIIDMSIQFTFSGNVCQIQCSGDRCCKMLRWNVQHPCFRVVGRNVDL